MLAHVLALAVGLGSFTLYTAAFFFPEVHRKHDFFWSGLGMLYALVLWTAAGQITGTVLLGQTTSVALLGWLGWQTLVLRRIKTPSDLQTPATAESWRGFQEEMTSLFQDFAAQTPIGRFLGFKRRPVGATAGSGQVKIRASSIRDVGYEFLDDLEETVEPARTAKTAQGPSQPVPPQQSPQSTNAPAPTPATAPTRVRPARPPKAAPAGKAVSAPRPAATTPVVATPARPKGAVGQAVEKVVVLKDWLIDLAGSFSRPKPSKPVIEIPPREPSVPLQRQKPPRNAVPAVVKDEPDLEDDAFWGEETEASPQRTTAPESSPNAGPASSAEIGTDKVSPSVTEPQPEALVEPINVEPIDTEEFSNWPESEYEPQIEVLTAEDLSNLTEAKSEPPAEPTTFEEDSNWPDSDSNWPESEYESSTEASEASLPSVTQPQPELPPAEPIAIEEISNWESDYQPQIEMLTEESPSSVTESQSEASAEPTDIEEDSNWPNSETSVEAIDVEEINIEEDSNWPDSDYEAPIELLADEEDLSNVTPQPDPLANASPSEEEPNSSKEQA